MNERLPYEEQLNEQMNDLPLPEENQAWDKMSLLLDKDDDRRIIPPIFLRSCLGWGLLLLAIAAFTWFYFKPFEKRKETSTALHEKRADENKNTRQPVPADSTDRKTRSQTPVSGIAGTPDAQSPSTVKGSGSITGSTTAKTTGPGVRAKEASRGNTDLMKDVDQEKSSTVISGKRKILKPDARTVKIKTGTGKEKEKSPLEKEGIFGVGQKVAGIPKKNEKANAENDPVAAGRMKPEGNEVPPGSKAGKDTAKDSSVLQPLKDSLIRKAKMDSPVVKLPLPPGDSAKKKKKYYFSAGIGLQQQIPIAGQSTTPYNRYGRKGGLADYIPSVYLRLHYKEKWFVQTDFRYGAPQSVKSISYQQNSVTVFDSTAGGVTVNRITTNTSLKRTFYHQVPLTFNYYVVPHLSFGTGIMYSKFFGAVSETELNKKDLQTGTETITRKINQVPANTDSFFTRSQVHLVLQTSYNWKRFYFGFRYTKALQPFLKYLDPNGALKEEKDQAFNVVVRFRIWKEK